jgi:transposase
MLSVPSAISIFLARDSVDFRKSHDGLLAIVRDQFGDDPMEGSLFVFLNRRRDRVKLLQWDRDGFWLHYKRLESGTFGSSWKVMAHARRSRARSSRCFSKEST